MYQGQLRSKTRSRVSWLTLRRGLGMWPLVPRMRVSGEAMAAGSKVFCMSFRTLIRRWARGWARPPCGDLRKWSKMLARMYLGRRWAAGASSAGPPLTSVFGVAVLTYGDT